MQEATISHNTWLHRVVSAGVRPLVNTRVTPNQLTTLRLVTGVGAAAAFLPGASGWNYAGAGLFLVSMLLDRADGELARLSGKTSPIGHRYDLVVDSLSNALVFLAIGIGAGTGLAVAAGTVASLSVLVVLAVVLRGEAVLGEGTVALPPAGRFDPDDAMIAIPIAMILGWGTPLVVAAAIGTPIMALVFLIKFRRIIF